MDSVHVEKINKMIPYLTCPARQGVRTRRAYTTHVMYADVYIPRAADAEEWPEGKESLPSRISAASPVQMTSPLGV